jgi:predicted RNA-binding protein YlqC (UPF0109 family)
MPNFQSQFNKRENIASPDYTGLVRFLLEPLLDSTESLKIDCEQLNHNQRVWIRVAFEASEKGRVYGRGGRNLQAIRTVLETAAIAAGQSLYLDIYGHHNHHEDITKEPNNQKFSKRRPRHDKSINLKIPD